MTPIRGLLFKNGSNRNVEAFPHANSTRCQLDRKSTTSYHPLVWGNVVTWRSKKKYVVARSTIKAEFIALAQGFESYCRSRGC